MSYGIDEEQLGGVNFLLSYSAIRFYHTEVNAALVGKINETLKQAAIEEGQWGKKTEIPSVLTDAAAKRPSYLRIPVPELATSHPLCLVERVLTLT